MEYAEFASVYDSLMQDVPYDGWTEFIIDKAGLKAGARGIDAACGTGSITVRLFKHRLRVIGADSSPQMLERAAQNARRAGAGITFVCQKLQQTDSPHKPDFITCVCDGINYITPAEAKEFFARAYSLLQSGGSLVFDISTEYKLKQVLGNNMYYEDKEDIAYFWRNSLKQNAVEQDITFFVRRQNGLFARFDEHHRQYIHSTQGLLKDLLACGFDVRVFDDYTDKAPTDTSSRAVFIAKKNG